MTYFPTTKVKNSAGTIINPATEDGKLTSLDTTLTAIKSTDGIKKITDTVTVTGAVTTSGTATVTATDLDIRDLTSSDVVTVTGGAGQTADVKVTLDSESVAVTGTFWQATQPVSGTVTANAGTNLNTSALALDATLTGGTAKAIVRGAAKGTTAAADATVTAAGANNAGLDVVLRDATGADLDFRTENENWNAADHGILVFGRDIASTPDKYRALALNTEGDLYVDLSDINGVEPTVGSGASSTGTLRVILATDQPVIPVSDNGGSLTVDGTFWQATQPVSAASLPLPTGAATAALQTQPGVDIGDVTINNGAGAAAVNIQDGGNTITVDGTVTANAGTNLNTSALALETGGNLAAIATSLAVLDDWDSSDTCKVTLQTGSAAIGKLAANSGVDIGDVDVTSMPVQAPSDKDITTHTNYARKYYTNAGAVTDGIVWSPAAGKRWHITSLYFQTSAAATITFEDDKAGGDDPVLKGEFAANSGLSLTFDPLYPMASGEDAADLIVTTSAGNIYITVVGYEV